MIKNAARPERLLWALCLLFLALFILYPIGRVLSEASPANWARVVLANNRWAVSLGNTLLLTALSTSLAVLTGLVYAYGVTRGGLPFQAFFSFIPVLHLVTPPFVGGLSFLLLFGRQGFFTKTLFHRDISLYGLPGLLIAQTLCFFPLAFLIIKDALEGMNPSLEHAARNAGAGRFHVFKTITLPLALPAAASSALFIAVSVISDFGNPMLIGGRFSVLAVELYSRLTGWADTGVSAVLGIILLVPAGGLFLAQRLFLRRRAARAAAPSRDARLPSPPPALPVRVLLFAFCSLVAAVAAAQFLAVIGGAFSRVWGADARFTAAHLIAAFSYKAELVNTLLFSLAAAFCVTALAAGLAFFTHRTALPLRRAADAAAMLPAAIPGSLAGLSFVLAFNSGPLRLTGTRALILLAMAVRGLPAAYRIMAASMQGIRPTLDDSARALGAGAGAVFFTVIAPLSLGGLGAAFVYTFVRCAGTLSAVIFLVTFRTKLASVLILNLAAQGDWGKSAALSLILTAIIFASLALLRGAVGKHGIERFLTKV